MRPIVRCLCAILVLASASAGCRVVGGIFRAGFWVGVIVTAIVVCFLLTLFRRRG